MNKLFTCSLLLLSIYTVKAQSYFREILAPSSRAASVYSLTPTANKTIILAADASVIQGSTPEAYMAELADNGALLWDQSFTFSSDDGATDAIKTTDSGYAMLTSSGFIIKMNPDHSVRFITKIRFNNSTYIYTRGGFVQTTDKGYVICGTYGQHASDNSNDIFLFKVDSLGNYVWSKKILDDGTPYKIKTTKDGGFLIAGTSRIVDGDGDMSIVKTDNLGNVAFSSVVGGPLAETAYDVAETSDSGYLLAGQTSSYEKTAGSSSGYIAKFNSTGGVVWTKTIKADSAGVLCAGIIPDKHNMYTIVSTILPAKGNLYGYENLLNVANNGKVNKAAITFIDSLMPGSFTSVCQGANESSWLSTNASPFGYGAFVVYKSDNNGNNCTPAFIRLVQGVNEGTGSLINRGAVDLAATTRSGQYTAIGNGNTNLIVQCSQTALGEKSSGINSKPVALLPVNQLSVSPNPVSSVLHIKGLQAGIKNSITVTDIMGQILITDHVTSSFYNTNIQKLSSGIYYVRIQSNSTVTVLKFIKE